MKIKGTGRLSVIWTALLVAPLLVIIMYDLGKWGGGPGGTDDL